MSEENLTFKDIAKKLNISQTELINRLELMEHMGYIKRISEHTLNDEKACSLCSEAKTCSDDQSKDLSNISYQITKKGKRVGNK